LPGDAFASTRGSLVGQVLGVGIALGDQPDTFGVPFALIGFCTVDRIKIIVSVAELHPAAEGQLELLVLGGEGGTFAQLVIERFGLGDFLVILFSDYPLLFEDIFEAFRICNLPGQYDGQNPCCCHCHLHLLLLMVGCNARLRG